MITEEDNESFRVDFANGTKVDVQELRRRGALMNAGGPHVWVIQSVYHLEDPEVAQEQMILGPDNFIGVSGIFCFCCGVAHRTADGPTCTPGEGREGFADDAVTAQ